MTTGGKPWVERLIALTSMFIKAEKRLQAITDITSREYLKALDDREFIRERIRECYMERATSRG